MAETTRGGAYRTHDGRTVNAMGKVIEVASDEPDGDKLPGVRDLASHIANMDVDAVKELQGRDERTSAAAIYEARLKELEDDQ